MKKILYILYKIKVWLLYRYCLIFPNKGTYNELLCYKNVFGVSKYIKVRKKVFGHVEQRIHKKNEKSIRIIMVDCSEWCTTAIYDSLKKMGADVGVVLSPFFHGTEESIRKAYDLCRDFCESRNLCYYEIYDPENWNYIPERWDAAKGDVLIYTNPWMGSYPKEIKINNIPLSSITCYIPYGFMLMKGEQHQFNQGSHNMFTRIYCESEIHRKMYADYCDIGNSHVEFSGHPKMDFYMEPRNVDERTVWNGVDGKRKMTKIIYSPHWNFDAGYATFLDNGFKILEYAETHTDTTSWIYKPHPLLEEELIVKGYMSSEEYRTYIKRWEDLPNARVYLSGEYGDIFISSDGIINDSVSFIAEYMYTHKPMLLLQNEQVEYNLFGKECVENVYTCNGCDIEAIIWFIENVKTGQDDMRTSREQFFDDNLNYLVYNQKNASDHITASICELCGIK